MTYRDVTLRSDIKSSRAMLKKRISGLAGIVIGKLRCNLVGIQKQRFGDGLIPSRRQVGGVKGEMILGQ